MSGLPSSKQHPQRGTPPISAPRPSLSLHTSRSFILTSHIQASASVPYRNSYSIFITWNPVPQTPILCCTVCLVRAAECFCFCSVLRRRGGSEIRIPKVTLSRFATSEQVEPCHRDTFYIASTINIAYSLRKDGGRSCLNSATKAYELVTLTLDHILSDLAALGPNDALLSLANTAINHGGHATASASGSRNLITSFEQGALPFILVERKRIEEQKRTMSRFHTSSFRVRNAQRFEYRTSVGGGSRPRLCPRNAIVPLLGARLNPLLRPDRGRTRQVEAVMLLGRQGRIYCMPRWPIYRRK